LWLMTEQTVWIINSVGKEGAIASTTRRK